MWAWPRAGSGRRVARAVGTWGHRRAGVRDREGRARPQSLPCSPIHSGGRLLVVHGADGRAAEGPAWPRTTLSAWPGKSRAVPPWVTLLYLYEPRGDTGRGDLSPSDGELVVSHPGNLSISPELDLDVLLQTAQPCTGPGPSTGVHAELHPNCPQQRTEGPDGDPQSDAHGTGAFWKPGGAGRRAVSGTQWAEPQAGPQGGSGGTCGRAGAHAAGRPQQQPAALRFK